MHAPPGPVHPRSRAPRVAAVGALSLLLLGASPPPLPTEAPPGAASESTVPFDAEAYYPLAPGNFWVWQGPGGAEDIRVRTVVGRVEGPDEIRAEVESADARGKPTHRDLLAIRGGMILRLASLFADGRRAAFEPPLLYAPFTAVVGEERDVDTRESDGTGAARTYKRLVRIHAAGVVETQLATFGETLAMVIADYPDPKFPVPEKAVTIWFARGFGPVRLQVENLAGKVVEDVVYARIGERVWGTDPRGVPTPHE